MPWAIYRTSHRSPIPLDYLGISPDRFLLSMISIVLPDGRIIVSVLSSTYSRGCICTMQAIYNHPQWQLMNTIMKTRLARGANYVVSRDIRLGDSPQGINADEKTETYSQARAKPARNDSRTFTTRRSVLVRLLCFGYRDNLLLLPSNTTTGVFHNIRHWRLLSLGHSLVLSDRYFFRW